MIPQYVVTAGLIFTVFSCGLCTLTTVVRVVYSVAEDGLIFSCLRSVNGKTQVPIWNVIVCSVLGILGSIVYDFNTLSHMVSATRKQKLTQRKFKVFLFEVFPYPGLGILDLRYLLSIF